MQLDPNWIAGFVDGEGTFYVGINKHTEMTAWFQVLPEFRIVQHERDIQLLHAIKKNLWCGVVCKNHDTRYEFRVRKLDHLQGIIIPFFKKHELHTKKKFDFIKFCKILSLINQGKHLDREWIKKILEIAKQMNSGKKEITEQHMIG